jgi:hypothetical protein
LQHGSGNVRVRVRGDADGRVTERRRNGLEVYAFGFTFVSLREA